MIHLEHEYDCLEDLEAILARHEFEDRCFVAIDAAKIGFTKFGHRSIRIGVAPSSGNVLVVADVSKIVIIAKFLARYECELIAGDLKLSQAPTLIAGLVYDGKIYDLRELECDPTFWDVLMALLHGRTHGISVAGKRWAFRRDGLVCMNDGRFCMK